jgi:hypothetical protein
VAATSVAKIEGAEQNDKEVTEAVKAWFVPWQH